MNASSIDNDLVETTKLLSMGASIVTNLDGNCALPRKLHPALYNSSLSDVSMSTQRHDTINKNNKKKNTNKLCTIGVPGFPDFPDCWQGETSQRRNRGDISMSYADKKHKNKCATTSKAKIKRQRRRIIRSAVNIIPKQYTSTNTCCTGKTIKKRNRDQRKIRRIEKVAQLQNRRRRKRDIGLLCKSLSSIKC